MLPALVARQSAAMAKPNSLRYDKMVEAALRGVVREALTVAAAHGLPGGHHFYITFKSGFPGVIMPDYLVGQYPDEMTIVLEHQFWGLEVEADKFSVTLSFQNRGERLTIPFAAITGFADPSVKFGLQFQEALPETDAEPAAAVPAPAPALPARAPRAEGPEPPSADKDKPGEVVALDKFRKK
jgi:hypothetical protein